MRQTTYLLAAALLWTGPLFAQTAASPQVLHFPGAATGTSSAPPAEMSTAGVSVTSPPPSPPQVAQEHLVTFDPTTVDVQWIDNRWQLLAGGVWLKDFGRREGDAREAVRLIRDLGLNQHGTVGTPRPVMEYWLADGQAPRGFARGQRVQALESSSLRVEEVQGQWCLRDARHLFFVFGPHRQEAQLSLDVIRRHGFTQVGFIGHPTPVLMYFLGGPDGLSGNHMEVPAPIVSRRKATPGQQQTDAGATAAVQPAPFHPAPPNPIGLSPLVLQGAQQLATASPLAIDQPSLGERVPFDCRQLKLRCDNQDWKLCSGDYIVGNFGPYESEAQRALHALQFYRCNEHCLVGQPGPAFSFFLANGQPPRGLMFGLNGQEFRPDSLTIRQTGADWAICADTRPLIRCGARVEDARKLLQIIRQQRFDHLCQVGPAPYGITLLVRVR